MPGYTHLQRAVPSSLGYWAAALAEGLCDALESLASARRLVDRSPLGGAAGFGVNLPLDRAGVAADLGFAGVAVNPMASQSSRGIVEAVVLSACWSATAIVRRFAWDVSLFATSEFGFVKLDEALTTLSDETAKRSHLAEIMSGSGTPNVRRGQAAQADALTKLHTAEVCLRCGAIDEAAKAAREALMARADLPGAIVVLVTALLAKDPRGPCIEALGWVTRGLKLSPEDDKLHVLAGRAHARRGDDPRALEHFVRAYKINSTNMDAVRELRAAATRHRAGGRTADSEGTAGGRLLAKLFGR